MIKVVSKGYVKKGCLMRVLDLYKELVEKSRMEEGCISYELYQDSENPNILTMIETWESKIYLEKHFQTEHFKRLVPQIKEGREGNAELNIYNKVI